MSSLHQKTYFKAATSIKTGEDCTLKVEGELPENNPLVDAARQLQLIRMKAEKKKINQKEFSSSKKSFERDIAANEMRIEIDETSDDSQKPLSLPSTRSKQYPLERMKAVKEDLNQLTEEELDQLLHVNFAAYNPRKTTQQIL